MVLCMKCLLYRSIKLSIYTSLPLPSLSLSLSLFLFLYMRILHRYTHFLVVILVLINSYSVKLTSRVTTVFTGLKLLAIVFVVAVAIITVIIRQCFPEEIHRPFQPLKGYEPSVSSVALALYGVMWAFDGWYV